MAAAGVLGGVVAGLGANRRLVATFWSDAETHRRYTAQVPGLRARAAVDADVTAMTGHVLELEPLCREFGSPTSLYISQMTTSGTRTPAASASFPKSPGSDVNTAQPWLIAPMTTAASTTSAVPAKASNLPAASATSSLNGTDLHIRRNIATGACRGLARHTCASTTVGRSAGVPASSASRHAP
jgi:hypothetical protein